MLPVKMKGMGFFSKNRRYGSMNTNEKEKWPWQYLTSRDFPLQNAQETSTGKYQRLQYFLAGMLKQTDNCTRYWWMDKLIYWRRIQDVPQALSVRIRSETSPNLKQEQEFMWWQYARCSYYKSFAKTERFDRKGISPKNGILRATTKVETTSAVLMRIAYTWDFKWVDGMSSSRLIATGDIVRAYVILSQGETSQASRYENINPRGSSKEWK